MVRVRQIQGKRVLPSVYDLAVLADIGYGPAHQRHAGDPRRIVIGTPPIGRRSRELWQLPEGPEPQSCASRVPVGETHTTHTTHKESS